MDDVVIASAVRTAVGKLGGALSRMSAVDLGAHVIRHAVERANLEPRDVDQVIMGTVVAAGTGQIPARQAALLAGLPKEVSATTINKVCASGLKAVNMAAQMIRAGDADVVVAGGMESMSLAPYLLRNARFGYRLGDGVLLDSMMHDGLNCPVGQVAMHEYGSDVAAEFDITREDQDRWSFISQRRWAEAHAAGRFDAEIVSLSIPQPGDEATEFDRDEQPRPGTTLDTLAKLKPLKEGGSVTAGNAPGINDGAAALVVLSRRKAEALGVKVLAEYVAHGEGNADNRYLHTVPALALEAALRKAQLDQREIGLYEINEAFAAVTIQVIRMLHLDQDCVNVNGGAVAIGHPIGASGARILGTLIHEMNRRKIEYGAASICSGMAQGEATIVRLPQS